MADRGLYFLDIDATSTRGLGAPAGSFLAAAFGLLPIGTDLVNNLRLQTSSLSLFGQAEYTFAPRWTLVVGGRVIREQQKYAFTSVAARDANPFAVEGGPVLFPLQPSFDDSRTEDLWAAKLQLEYRPVAGALLYAGLNRGVKAGSYNALILPPSLPPDQIPYAPEVLLTVEAGAKISALDGRLSLDASVFHYKYKDYQAFTFRNAGGFVQNKDATNTGVDVSVAYRPTDALTVRLIGSFMEAKVKGIEIAPGLVRDVRPTYAPEQQLQADIEYQLPGGFAGGHVTLGYDVSYTSDFYTNIRNFRSQRVSAYSVSNARIRWEDEDGGLSVTGRVTNMFDERYGTIGFDSTELFGSTQLGLGLPRWWTLSASYRF